jgi:hypothetical protein
MDFNEANGRYENWLGRFVRLVRKDLKKKHRSMAESPFAFFRATVFRWAQLSEHLAGDLTTAPEIMAVGDAHVENFGTWRDQEGRLIWGINDFDEAYPLPYTADLIRLAVSAVLATAKLREPLSIEAALEPIIAGYKEALKNGAGPFVLAGQGTLLDRLPGHRVERLERFWKKLNKQMKEGKVPRRARKVLLSALPQPAGEVKFARRVAGLGSLGRPRFVAVTEWFGERVVREVKARAPSAWSWESKPPRKDFYERIVTKARRVPDPSLMLTSHWVIRRLSPDCARLDLTDLSDNLEKAELLRSMGAELGNAHSGTGDTKQILAHLSKARNQVALVLTSEGFRKAVEVDFEAWRGARGLKRTTPPTTRTVAKSP